ncbi:MAG: beta-lactamase family protein [Oscillospiraceae bacterium]|nr:beta-lactamase family protein [Oscillospiraceae bacterium]
MDRMNFDALKNCLDHIVKDYKAPGIDCVVYQNHKEIFRYYTGYSDLESGKRMQGDELYLIFSMSKMITCTAALQLLEQGKYLLSDPISKYMPEFENMKVYVNDFDVKEGLAITSGKGGNNSQDNGGNIVDAKNKITVKDLFTMAGGLDYAVKDQAISTAIAEGKKTTREIVGAMSNKVLGFEPGTRFRYSLCHDVLGALIEIWSGESLGEYIENHICKPLGMEDTFFGLPKDDARMERIAGLYSLNNQGEIIKLPLGNEFKISEEYESGGAGLVSCVKDYSLFLDALACKGVGKNGNRILSPATIELMGTNHMKGKQCEDFYNLRPGYGYGLGVRTHVDKTVSGSLSPIGEFGWDGAAGAFSMVDTKNSLSLTYFQHQRWWDVRMQTEMRNALYSCLE